MGSFSIMHWLIVLLVIGVPIALIVILVNRSKAREQAKRLRGPTPNDGAKS